MNTAADATPSEPQQHPLGLLVVRSRGFTRGEQRAIETELREFNPVDAAAFVGDIPDVPNTTKPDWFLLPSGLVILVKHESCLPDGKGAEMVRNEAAAYEVAKLMGLDHIVLPTVRRTLPRTTGEPATISVVVAVFGGVEGMPLDQVPVEDVRLAAAFDIAVGQPDRRIGNWFVVSDGDEHRLQLFDHGFCFNFEPSPKMTMRSVWAPGEVRSVAVTSATDVGGPDEDALRRLLVPGVLSSLEELLTVEQIANMVERVSTALAS
jgi:hypothetical protein